jgi:hypothetical protein
MLSLGLLLVLSQTAILITLLKKIHSLQFRSKFSSVFDLGGLDMWHLGENIEMWGCSVISGRTKSISLSLFKLPITIVIKK